MALTDSLLHYYSFNSSNSNDQVGSNNGTDTSVTYSEANGKVGVGGGFASASSSKIAFAAMGYVATDSVSWGGWVNLTTTGADRSIFSHADSGASWDCLLRYDNGAGKFIAAVVTTGQHTATSTTTPSTGTWYHVMGVWTSGSHIKIYVNGSNEATTNTATTSLRGPTGTWLAGSFSGSNFMNGAIDELGFWNRALTADEVSELYNGGTGLTYPFTGGSGPANLKSLSGNVKANIKSMSGNTLANMKSLSGNA